MKMEEIDFLPTKAWRDSKEKGKDKGRLEKYDKFIATTMDLHQSFLERLGDLKSEPVKELEAIDLSKTKATNIVDAVKPLVSMINDVQGMASEAFEFGKQHPINHILSPDQIASIHLCKELFSKSLNLVSIFV